MKFCLPFVFAICTLIHPAFAEDPQVKLVQGEQSVKVLIGEDVFTVYRYGTERRKPFFQPVTGPGGYELLKKAVATEAADGVGRKVFVVSETATLQSDDGKSSESNMAHYGEILEVGKVDGNRLWIEAKAGWIARSDIAPLAAVITRLINDEAPKNKQAADILFGDKYDHIHHKGIWFSVDEINDIKFWMEASLIRTQSVKLLPGSGNSASMHIVNHWLDLQDQPILIESTTVTISPDRLLTYDVEISPAGDEVHIGDTKEGLLAIRLASPMREKSGGGPVTTSEGIEGTRQAWGKTASWVNYDGPVDGHIFGVTLMDYAKNPIPSRYHVRDYGLFSINPFGAEAYTKSSNDPQPPHARTLKKGESLHFKFGAWVHGDGVDKDSIEQTFQKFEETKVE